MSRPIKFIQRIGLGEKAYWHHWGFLDKPKGFISPMANSPMAYSESFEFTGLLDKDGKEIFEGARWLWDSDLKSILSVDIQMRGATGEVKWMPNEGAFRFYYIGGRTIMPSPYTMGYRDRIKIIGHIAEGEKDE